MKSWFNILIWFIIGNQIQEYNVKVDAKKSDYTGEEPMYSTISILRAVALKLYNKERWVF